jgi:hypothetical protein
MAVFLAGRAACFLAGFPPGFPADFFTAGFPAGFFAGFFTASSSGCLS